MVYIKYDPKNNLPTDEAILSNQGEKEFKLLESAVCFTNEANQNFTPSQKELLRCHFRLVHIWLQHVQWLILTGSLKVQGNSNSMVKCKRTKCAAREFGKGRRLSNKVNITKKNPMKEPELNNYHLMPVHMVCGDHYILRDLGRLYYTKG